MRHTGFRLLRPSPGMAAAVLLLWSAGCGKSGPKPADADVAAYLARAQPTYLRVGHVETSFEPMTDLGASKLPAGSWKIVVHFVLHAEQDLFAPTAETRSHRAAFDRAIGEVELYRVARIAAVNQLGKQAGLVAPGATAPEPAVAVGLVTHKDQDLPDQVTLLAEPDGQGWKFFQLDAQSLSDDAIGTPMDDLRSASPTVRFVTAGTDEAKADAAKEQRFLDVLAKAGRP